MLRGALLFGAMYSDGYGICVDPSGSPIVTGNFQRSIDSGQGSLMATGVIDGVLAKLTP